MRGLMIIGDGFEDTEALVTRDVLYRGGENIFLASAMDSLEVSTQTGLKIKCDGFLSKVDYKEFDYLIIPGGKASFTVLHINPLVEKIIDFFVLNKKLVACICAAPFLVGRKGYYKGRHYTVFPGFEKEIIDGVHENVGVVIDGPFITAKSMYYSIEFGLKILEYLHGLSYALKIEKSLKGE